METMSIDGFFILLEKYLNDFQNKPYDSDYEGKIYVGINETFSNFADERERKYFVNYLCMIVSLDLKIYEVKKEQYSNFKKVFNTPKFEYGLSNIYYYPDAIFSRFNVCLDTSITENCFNNFFKFFYDKIESHDLKIDLNGTLNLIAQDKDISTGNWGNDFCHCILKRKL